MHIDSAKGYWNAALMAVGLLALSVVQAADAPANFQVVDGVAIYLGVLPAQMVRGHAREHEERKMHGGVSAGRRQGHVVLAVFDDATGQRIQDAQITATVMELGLGSQWKTLEPMRIAGVVTYGNYFDMPENDIYHVQVQIRRPGHTRPIKATFTHGHFEQ